MKTHQQIAKEAIGFAPRKMTADELRADLARLRRINEARQAAKLKKEVSHKP